MKILLTIIYLFIFSYHSFAQDCNIGIQDSTEIEFVGGLFLQDYVLGVKFTLEEEGVLKSLNLIGRNTGSQVQMVVYDDLDGVPNDLIAQSNIGTVGEGIVSFPVSETNLSIGDYWIMAAYDEEGYHTYIKDADSLEDIVYYMSHVLGDSIPDNAADFISYNGLDITYFMEIKCGISSVSEIDHSHDWQIWPNPSDTDITIQSTIDFENIKMFDIHGQLVRECSKVAKQVKLDVSNLGQGIYVLLIESNNKLVSKRFVKK